MESVIFKTGLSSELPSEHTAGTFYMVTDEPSLYLDTDDSTRICLSGDASGTTYHGTIGTEWTEDAATGVKYQLVAIEGVTAAMDGASLDAVMPHERTTEGYTLFVEEQNQFLTYITNGDAETVDGGVMFYIYGEANTVEIPFILEVG